MDYVNIIGPFATMAGIAAFIGYRLGPREDAKIFWACVGFYSFIWLWAGPVTVAICWTGLWAGTALKTKARSAE